MARNKEISSDIRQSVIVLRQENYSYREIAKKLSISVNAVMTTLQRYAKTGSNKDRKRSGRPRVTSKSEEKHLRLSSLRNRRLTVPQLTSKVNETRTTPVSDSTVRRRLKAAGLHGRISSKKPLLRPQNRVKRLAWAKKHRNWTYDNWKNVLWTDESKFEIFNTRRRVYVRRRIGERYIPACVTPTVKHGGGSVMVWGCFGAEKVGDLHQVQGILNQHGYHSILQRHAIPSGTRLIGPKFVFQQDNDPKHTSRLCKNYLANKENANVLQIMQWPPQSPDLNPIELLWDELDRKAREMQPTSAKHLWECLQNAWEAIPQSCLSKLTARMVHVCRAVIKAKGGYFQESKI